MNEIEHFFGKSLKKEIDGVELEFSPLLMDNLEVILEMNSANVEKRKEAIKKVVMLYLKQLFPNAKEGDYQKIPVATLLKIGDAALEVNGLLVKDERPIPPTQ